MKYFVRTDEFGRVIESGGSNYIPNGCVEVQELIAGEELRLVDGRLVDNTPPSNHHEWLGGQWVFDRDAFLAEVREQRSALFRSTAWIRERASDRGEPVPQEWLDYWQALRDITDQDVHSIEWPQQP